jgi:hypothetical protein
MKLALFSNIELGYTSICEEWAENSSDYIRVSEYVDVDFPALKNANQVQDLIALARKEREASTERYNNIMNEIKNFKVKS